MIPQGEEISLIPIFGEIIKKKNKAQSWHDSCKEPKQSFLNFMLSVGS
jgi:hypothetical protein